jgi:hypothetical protein
MWEYRATLPLFGPNTLSSVVHDGDTVRFLIDKGMDDYSRKWVRFAGVRSPETNEPGIVETRNYVMDWLDKRYGWSGTPVRRREWPFRIVTEVTGKLEPSEVTSFVRYVGWVYDIETGECLNEQMRAYLAQHPEWPAGREALF